MVLDLPIRRASATARCGVMNRQVTSQYSFA